MKIQIKIKSSTLNPLSEQEKEAYLAELQARISEVYPESLITIIPALNDITDIQASDFFNDEEVDVTIEEIIQDVSQNGYWHKA